ncbi:MAG: ATP-dependent DNA ligase [Saprospiraceae bacterium]|nr:ATP-dependent DNA ligase [Saprospiraceae bacterium]
MKDFASLVIALDQTTKTNERVRALAEYLGKVSDRDKLWTIAILSHRRPKRTVTTTLLRNWAAEKADLPQWLFEDSYHVVGDLAETIALLLPPPFQHSDRTLSDWIAFIRELEVLSEADKKARILEAWDSLGHEERFIFNKLITGGFRIGISQKLMVRALALFTGLEENLLAHRLMGAWSPDTDRFDQLLIEDNPSDQLSRPYPFYLCYALEGSVEELGDPANWMAERKWDGIRAQLIVRAGNLFVWSRGEELMTDKFPEFEPLAGVLPDYTVLDGEILPFREGIPLDFQALQTRIGRKQVTRKVLQEVPVILMGYDLLELGGKDLRQHSFADRRKALCHLLEQPDMPEVLKISPELPFTDWAAVARERADSRKYHCEGLMLKHKDSTYQQGRKKGEWWKWKVDPMTIDAVMIYAQQGHGRRANLFTDFTFAVRDGEAWVPFTKAYSGLTDAEFQAITHWVRKNTLERFGPVRSVSPVQVFELAFEGISASPRHKSGIALRFPRMLRWRKDKQPEAANTLQDLKDMLESYGE